MGLKLYYFVKKNILNILCISLIMIFSGIYMIKPIDSQSTTIKTEEKDKSIKSKVILNVQMKRINDVKKVEDDKKIEEEKKKQEEEKEKIEETKKVEANSQPSIQPSVQARAENTLASGSGRVTYYSLNGGNVACGTKTVNSLYSDPTYGNVRGLAAGREFPCGTIININGAGMGNFTGVVIDRGGAIGTGRRNMFDILVNNDSIAYQYGVSYVTYQVLRMGW